MSLGFAGSEVFSKGESAHRTSLKCFSLIFFNVTLMGTLSPSTGPNYFHICGKFCVFVCM